MSIKIRLTSVLFLWLGCTFTEQAGLDEHVIAEINGLVVTEQHFINAFKEYYYRTGQVLGQDPYTKEAVLNSTFGTYVLATYAKDLGLDKTERAIQKKGAIIRRVLTEEYLDQVILSTIEVSEEEVREYFVRFNSQLRASHIYAKTEEDIKAFYERLNQGEAFEDLAREAFENPYLANNGGDVGRFTTDEMDIAFENAAFDLNVGEISEPVRTMQGYSIIKLTDRVVNPFLLESEFAKVKDNLTDYAYSKKKELLQREHMFQFIDALVFNDEVFDNLWEAVSSNYNALLQKDPEFFSNLERDKALLATYGDFEFSIRQFVEELLVSDDFLINTIKDEASFKDFIKGTAYRAYMVAEAKRLGIDKQKLVTSSIEETWLNYLSVEADNYLRDSITNTPAELYHFYTKNRSDFFFPEEVNLQRLVLRSKEEAERMLDLLEAGVSFDDLVSNNTISNEDLFTNGVLGFESINSYGFMAPAIARLEIGEVSEVLQYQNNEYHIYKLLGRKEAEPMSFDQAREQIDRLLRQNKLRKLRKETIEQVKQRHKAYVNLEKLKELSIQI